MVQSRYNVLLEDFPQSGTYYLYNTRTQAKVVIDKTLRDALERLHARTALHDSDSLSKLAHMGFLVEDPEQEEKIIEQWFDQINHGSSIVKAKVLTTYECNFACTYCVEEGVKASVRMSPETARRCAQYIEKKVEEHSPEELYVSFHGGEPLINPAALKIIAWELNSYCRQREIPFLMGITTNGALLTPRLVDELVEYGLKGVKITLDGTREFHDAKRPFKNGKGSFDLIMKNILYAVDRVEVDIGGNFDDENYESFQELLDYLKERDLDRKIHKVSFKPISETVSDRGRLAEGEEFRCVYSDPHTARRMVKLREAVMEKGFNPVPGIGPNLCDIVMNDAIFTVDPLGKIYKCPALVGYTDFEVGDIERGETVRAVPEDLWKRCLDCTYLPLCGVGCLFSSYVRFGDALRLNCQREYVEYMVHENLKLNYRFSKKKNL